MSRLIKFSQTVLNGGVDEASYREIQKEMHQGNRKVVRYFSCVAALALAGMLITSLQVESLSGNRPIYLAGFLITVLIWSVATFVSDDRLAIHKANMYLFSVVLLGVGVALGTWLGPKEISATYIAFLLTVPQIFTDRPYKLHIIITASVVAFIVIALKVKDPMTWSSDITNAILFGFLSILLCTYSISTRVTRLVLERRIQYLASNDQLTGLRNRYSYEEFLRLAAVQEETSVYCVYVDVNGLHELNNTKGHEAGDRMLQTVASLMQEEFGEKETYRIGGDEFVAVGMRRTLEEVRTRTDALKAAVEKAGYVIAAGIGYREKNEISVDSLVKDAEKAMYIDKSDYYRKNGIDRRRR